MSDQIDVAPGLPWTAALATKTLAILAQRGAGKTHAAKVIAEEFVRIGQPWVAIDPLGAWYGLRSALPVVIIGGEHGDVPLERAGGKFVADLVTEEPGWYVLDLGLLGSKAADRQFATDFAERLFRAKAHAKFPLHVFIDEADIFAPQRGGPGDARMLGAFETLVRRGRIRGLGATLISQRAAVLNKNVLEMLDILVALRTVGSRDRDAIEEYLRSTGSKQQVAEVASTLPSLERGTAWIWEPGESIFGQFQIRALHTFDSSATPTTGSDPVALERFAAVDLDAVKERMAAAIARAEQEDPALLRRRIGELERQIGAPEVVTEEIEVLPAGLADALAQILGLYDRTIISLGEARSGVETMLEQLRAGHLGPQKSAINDRDPGQAQPRKRPPAPKPAAKAVEIPASSAGDARAESARNLAGLNAVEFNEGESRILAVLARDGASSTLHIARCAIYARGGGGFRSAMKRLSEIGAVGPGEGSSVELLLDPAPIRALIDLPDPLEAWCAHPRMGESSQRILRWLAAEWPEGHAAGECAEAVGMAASGGGFRTAYKRLRSFELLDGGAIARELAP